MKKGKDGLDSSKTSYEKSVAAHDASNMRGTPSAKSAVFGVLPSKISQRGVDRSSRNC